MILQGYFNIMETCDMNLAEKVTTNLLNLFCQAEAFSIQKIFFAMPCQQA